MGNNVRQDLYAEIGVLRTASQQEIEKACLELAAQYRPDQHPNDPDVAAKFAAIEAAYTILSDPVKRAEYDRTVEYADISAKQKSSSLRLPIRIAVSTAVAASIIFGGWYLLGERTPDVELQAKPATIALRQTEPNRAEVAAYSALKKLQASTEVGITYIEYRRLLGETWYAVKSYLESPESRNSSAFAKAMTEAMQRYNNAAVIWQARMEGENDYTSKYLKVTDCPTYERKVCERAQRLLQEIADIQTFVDAQGRMTISLEDELQRQWQLARKPLKDAEAFK